MFRKTLSCTLSVETEAWFLKLIAGSAGDCRRGQLCVQHHVAEMWPTDHHDCPRARQDRAAFLAQFRVFSINFTPIFCLWYTILFTYSSMVPHPPFFRPHVYGFRRFFPLVLRSSCLSFRLRVSF